MNKKLSLLSFLSVVPIMLCGCNKDEETSKLTFKDAHINEAVSVDSATKKEARSKVKNYLRKDEIYDVEMPEDATKEDYYEVINSSQPFVVEKIYYSSEDKSVSVSTGDEISYSVNKVGSQFEITGYLSDFMPAEYNQTYAKAMYEYLSGDSIYSFGLVESLGNLHSSDLTVNTSANATASLSMKIDEEWYEKIVCTDYVKKGTFTVGLSSPISVSTNVTTTYQDQVVSISVTASYKYMELKYENYRCVSQLVYADQTTNFDNIVATTGTISYSTYTYNLDKAPFVVR